jgi:predicted HTH transcriptional regulator
VLTASEIEVALRAGRELRRLELKGPGLRTNSPLFVKVARAALSMGNMRDGGQIVIGIDDTDIQAMKPGLDAQQLASWLAYDDVGRGLAEYANPPLEFDIVEMTLSSGATVVVLNVHEFADMPHLCGKLHDGVLRPGALYVRSRKMPETAEVASLVEMREVLDLATEKALRAYVSIGERAGVTISAGPSDEARYEQQRNQSWGQ